MALSRAFSMNVRRMLKIPKMLKAPQIRNTGTSSTGSLTSEDMALIQHHFQIANKHVYKKLNMAEYNHLISLTTGRKLDDVDLRLIFKGLDLNKDEYISLEEVASHFKATTAPLSEGTIAFAFCRFDKDGNDRLYLHELKEALFYLGFIRSGHPRVHSFFKKQDTDQDLQINFEQFKHIVQKDMPSLR